MDGGGSTEKEYLRAAHFKKWWNQCELSSFLGQWTFLKIQNCEVWMWLSSFELNLEAHHRTCICKRDEFLLSLPPPNFYISLSLKCAWRFACQCRKSEHHFLRLHILIRLTLHMSFFFFATSLYASDFHQSCTPCS